LGGVDQSVDVADIQGVDVKLPEPPQRAFDEKTPHLVAAGPVDVDVPVRACEVRAEGHKGIPLDSRLEERSPQQDGEALPVTGIDEALQPRRSSPGRRDRAGQACRAIRDGAFSLTERAVAPRSRS